MILERSTLPLLVISLFLLKSTFAADGTIVDTGNVDVEMETGKLENKEDTSEKDILRYLLSNRPISDDNDPISDDAVYLNLRPPRKLGSEFLGKRGMDDFIEEGKRGLGREFLGKRRLGSEFLGKRRLGSEFLGKRRLGSEFLGKRRLGSEFLGKRSSMEDNREEWHQPATQRIPLEATIAVGQLPAGLQAPDFKLFRPNGLWGKRARLGSEFLG